MMGNESTSVKPPKLRSVRERAFDDETDLYFQSVHSEEPSGSVIRHVGGIRNRSSDPQAPMGKCIRVKKSPSVQAVVRCAVVMVEHAMSA